MKRQACIVPLVIITLLRFIIAIAENEHGSGMNSIQDLQSLVTRTNSTKSYNKKFCDCYNASEGTGQQPEIECRCFGKNFTRIPSNLQKGVQKIIITDSDIRFINRDAFQPYKDTLMDVTLGNLPKMRVIEKGIFRDIPRLRTVYITNAPQIKFLHDLLMGVTTRKFLTLRIIHTGLHEIPRLDYLHPDNILHMLDLEGNKLEKVPPNSVKINAEQAIFNYNDITVVDNFAFNGSQIARLSFNGNKKLTTLKPNAFARLHSLRTLDLSGTSITRLPIVGIENVEELKIEGVATMKTIPSIYELKSLKDAHLTHPFHCCAFKYPKQHDPAGYAQYQANVKQICESGLFPFDTGQLRNDQQNHKRKRRKRSSINDSWSAIFSWPEHLFSYKTYDDEPDKPEDWLIKLNSGLGSTQTQNVPNLAPLQGHRITSSEGVSSDLDNDEDEDDFGTFHETSAELPENSMVQAFCGNISSHKREIFCYPEPNALNPCEDIMGFVWLRVSVWFVVILSISGNLLVIIVLTLSKGGLNVSRFLMCNLAFADICMGLYLLLIASMDLHSVGTYFNFAYDWQYGVGCQIAGFLTVFASHLSIYTLTVITLERWFAITYALHLTKRIGLRQAVQIMLVGWLYSILVSALPLFGISNYSSTSICLPMEVNTIVDKVYLVAVFLLNGMAFVIIVFCYARIYLSLGYETRRCNTRGEMTIAKKMALLVFTDFACWAPVTFFSLTALAGYPLIGVTESKILLVFFFPLNSCANPYLYAIMTAQFRKDFFILLSRCGLCTKRAQQYTVATSVQTQNNTHPIPLLSKSSNGHHFNKSESHIQDDLV
ncbi:thyrotropin receptor-like isoform X2 [Agrilus planipennis]|nr:thyrotropin receptor-like isoform X2 [Agrilus planipennis]